MTSVCSFAAPPRLHALLLAALLCAATLARAGELSPAPPLTAVLLDGGSFSTGENSGKVILVNFWASWCPPCRAEMPALDNFYRRHRERGLEMIAISLDEASDADKVREIARAFAFPVAMSSQARFKGFGRIWRLPMTFVIDRQGKLREDITGKTLQVDLAFLEARVAPLLGP